MLATMKVNLILMFLCLAFIVCVTSGYERKWLDDDSPHEMNRRACANSGQRCETSIPCCSVFDTCLTYINNNGATTFCQDISVQVRNGNRLLDGAECEDSSQCADGCCREYRVLRQGRQLSCGRSSDSVDPQYTCISNTPY